VVVDSATHQKLMALPRDAKVALDLAAQTLTLPDGTTVEFPVDAFSKYLLLEGVDELGYILQQDEAIKAYEATRASTLNTLAA
jgi:3-isopropylmalate/(R)-2-methylmalate dehydratase small subunit